METVCVCGKGYLCDFLKFLCCVVLGILYNIFFFVLTRRRFTTTTTTLCVHRSNTE